MISDSTYIKISIGLNVILGLLVLYMFVFSNTTEVKRYEAEISRLETENRFLIDKYDELTMSNDESKERVKVIDGKINDVSKSLINVNRELKKIEKNGRKDKEDYVNGLSDDSVAVEFTNYLQRRNKR